VGSEVYEQLAFATAANVVVLFMILGVIGMTQEYRHRTATPTFLTAPRRWRVVVAKLVAYALAAVPFALAVLVVNYLVVLIHAGARGAAPSLTGDNLRVLASSGLALVIYAVIGVGIGALVRNQVVAVVGLLVLGFAVDPAVAALVPEVGRFSPFSALPIGITDVPPEDAGLPEEVDVLSPGLALLAMLAWIGAAFAAGAALLIRRDLD
jgi:ABC-type transport system involved in multi-copper enzyme maturation permease subunit